MTLKLVSNNSSIDFNNMYVMNYKFLRGSFKVIPEKGMENTFCNQLYEGSVFLKEAICFRQDSGGKPKDIILYGPGILMYSARFINVLSENGFTGWNTYPVEIIDKNGVNLEGYYGLSITGRCGAIDKSRAQDVMIPSPSGNWLMQKKVGLYFDTATWDGRDLFNPSSTLITLVTEPVKKAIDKLKISNIEFVRLTEYIHP